jgi:hypothetical protein
MAPLKLGPRTFSCQADARNYLRSVLAAAELGAPLSDQTAKAVVVALVRRHPHGWFEHLSHWDGKNVFVNKHLSHRHFHFLLEDGQMSRCLSLTRYISSAAALSKMNREGTPRRWSTKEHAAWPRVFKETTRCFLLAAAKLGQGRRESLPAEILEAIVAAAAPEIRGDRGEKALWSLRSGDTR